MNFSFSREIQPADSSRTDQHIHFPWKFVVPSAMLIVGAASIGSNGIFNSEAIQQSIVTRYPDFSTDADDFLQFVPAAAVYGLNLAGVKGRHNLLDATLLLGLSAGISGVIVYGTKEATHILRPDGSSYNSFPSGHTTMAFVSATFLYEEYKERSVWYGVGGYAVASVTGGLRMLNNRHWFSDVMAGAGLGILVTEVVYAVYPHIRDKVTFGKKKNIGMIPVVPGGGMGLSMVMVF